MKSCITYSYEYVRTRKTYNGTGSASSCKEQGR